MSVTNYWAIMPLIMSDAAIMNIAEARIENITRTASTLLSTLNTMVRYGVIFNGTEHLHKYDPIMTEIRHLNRIVTAMVRSFLYQPIRVSFIL